MIPFIRSFLKRFMKKNKDLFFQEAQRIPGFLKLLMKQRNSDEKLTPEERQQVKEDLKVMAMYIPALIIFLLPGGSLLIPVLAEVMDRRKVRRLPPTQPPEGSTPPG